LHLICPYCPDISRTQLLAGAHLPLSLLLLGNCVRL